MLFNPSDRIFDTLIDPRRNYGTMKTRFGIRRDVQVDGKCPVYLFIGGNEVRINLKIYVDPKIWVKEKRRIREIDRPASDINLMLDNHEAKITNIKTVYRLSELTLTAKILESEFLDKNSRVNFIAFFHQALKEEKVNLKEGSYERHHSVYKKLLAYNPNVPFNELTLKWFNDFKSYCQNELENENTTIAANIASIKKFLRIATKNGIKLLFDLDDVKVGSTKGNRTFLNETELRKCLEVYNGNTINPSYKIILGYFLFSCMTGLRISNIQALERREFANNDFSMVTAKSNSDKNIALNETAQKIIESCEDLFVKKFADQHINDELKKIMRFIGITKHVTMHVGRHTFATLYLKVGGSVENLQMTLGHGSITQTMVYVHIVQADANREIFVMDKLFR